MLRNLALIICLIIPGVLFAVVCGYFALVDFAQLQKDYSHYQAVVNSGAGIRAVFVAYSGQEIHRTNLFADGVWALLSLVIAGVGALGLCINSSRK